MKDPHTLAEKIIDLIQRARGANSELEGEALFIAVTTATDMVKRERVGEDAHQYADAIRTGFEQAYGYDDAEDVPRDTLLQQAETNAFRMRDAIRDVERPTTRSGPGGP